MTTATRDHLHQGDLCPTVLSGRPLQAVVAIVVEQADLEAIVVHEAHLAHDVDWPTGSVEEEHLPLLQGRQVAPGLRLEFLGRGRQVRVSSQVSLLCW